MISPGKYFKNKKITVMGLGLHGGGVAVVNWLIKHGALVTVTDLKTKTELVSSLNELKAQRNTRQIKLVLGRHREIDFQKADLIIQNPGVPRNSKYLKIAKEAGIPIENEASLFFKHCPAKIIGVTGTRGKSTTASLIYEILKGSKKKVWLAGLPKKPMLGILDQVGPKDLVVLELSSWQLEILGDQRLSPDIAVLTNIYPDHLNRYNGMADYIQAKANIFKYQNRSQYVILNADNQETKKLASRAVSQRFLFSKKYFSEQNGSFVKNGYIYFRYQAKVKKLANAQVKNLIGEHNLANILAAVTVAGILDLQPKTIVSGLNNFTGLPGRLELIKEKKGVKYINDTTATTPDGTLAALKALPPKIILIAGGETKNIPQAKYQELARAINQSCKALVLFAGRGSQQIISSLKLKKNQPLVFGIDNMKLAVSLAASFAKPGDIILLSPACASFNLFVNEFDRGHQFNQVIKDLL